MGGSGNLGKDIGDFPLSFEFRNRGKDDSPCGVLISTQAEYDPQGLTPRGERKDAKHAKFRENRRLFFFAPWRLGAIIFFEAVLVKT